MPPCSPAFITPITPEALAVGPASVGKNSRYCDFSLITKDEMRSKEIPSNLVCICLDTVPNSVSPILSVPATVLKPSGAKKIRSPPIS